MGYPIIVRPSYVLGGRAMEIVHNEKDLRTYMDEAVQMSNDAVLCCWTSYLNQAVEVDVDYVSDGENVVIGGDDATHRTSRCAFR